MKLWIDDLRSAPSGWSIARSSTDAIQLLHSAIKNGVIVEVISFDHDLGGEDTTRPVVLWMIEHDVWPGQWYVHTANPVGREWLEGMLEHYGKINKITGN